MIKITDSRLNQYIVFVVGALLLILGGVIFTHTIAAEDMTFWLPTTLILAGVLILPSSNAGDDPETKSGASSATQIIALVLLFVGVYIILRMMGLISTPVLKYVLGGGLSIIGLYGMVSSGLRIYRSSPSVS